MKQHIEKAEDEIRILFEAIATFSFHSSNYVIFEKDGRLFCGKIGLNSWDSIQVSSAVISDRVLAAAWHLMSLESDCLSPDRIEHFNVKDCGDVFIIEETRKESFRVLRANQRKRMRSFLSFLILFVVAVVCWLLYLKSSSVIPVENLFEVSAERMKCHLLAVELLGSCGIKMLFRTDRIGHAVLIPLAPLNLLTLAAVLRYSAFVRVTVLLFVLISAVMIVLLYRNQRETGRKKDFQRNLVTIICVPVISAILIAYLAVNLFSVTGYVKKSSVPENVEDNLIFVIQEDASGWEAFSEQEKIDYLQRIADYETEYLGCSGTRVVSELLRDGVLGHYVNYRKEISVDTQHLRESSLRECLNTLLHELRHHFQYEGVLLLERIETAVDDEMYRNTYLDQLRAFRYGYRHYKTTCDNQWPFEDYYRQYIERDAREYAEERYESFYSNLFQ